MVEFSGRYRRWLKVIGMAVYFTLLIVIASSYSYFIPKPDDPRGEYMKFVEYAAEDDLADPFIHKRGYKFSLNEENICDGNVFLLMYVLSAPENIEMRQAIRRTWGSVRTFNDYQIKVIFLFGEPRVSEQQKALVLESKEYHDIVEGNFIDDYVNLTYKSVLGLHWVNNYCKDASFVLKIDDDVMLNIYKLVDFLQETTKKPYGAHELLYCHVEAPGVGVVPVRNKESKFALSLEEYPYRLYPPYCSGPGYVFSSDVASLLYEATLQVPYFKFEDIYIGFCAHTAGVIFTDDYSGFYIDTYDRPHTDFDITILKHLRYPTSRTMTSWHSAWDDIQRLNTHGTSSHMINILIIALCIIITALIGSLCIKRCIISQMH